MNRMISIIIAVTLLALAILAACQPQAAAPTAVPTQATKAAQGVRPPWQDDWENTLAAAKKEGKVVIITSMGGDSASTFAKAFREKYALDTEFVLGRAPEIYTKVSRERMAGLYLEDVYMAGLSSLVTVREPGFLEPMKPYLVLPEAIDPKSWRNGRLSFLDDPGLMLAYQERVVAPLLINADLVKMDEIKSYKDLLDPKWKGKIVAMDPSIGSAGTIFFFILWEMMGPDFTGELAKQDIAITRDGRQQAEWLARGKYPVSGTLSSAPQTEFVKAGAPIKVVLPAEGTFTSASTGAVALMNKGPHPNATKVFINWLLTKEGQTLLSQTTGDPSRRVDISHEWVDPALIPRPGYKLLESDNEEMIKKRLELQKVSRDVWNLK